MAFIKDNEPTIFLFPEYFDLTEEDFAGIGHAIMAIEEGY